MTAPSSPKKITWIIGLVWYSRNHWILCTGSGVKWAQLHSVINWVCGAGDWYYF